jgi:hypothetical protein
MEAPMPLKTGIRVGLTVLAVVTLLPAMTSAQTGVIGGVVLDTTGAVMPGVTVEASSPALIEKVRTAVTDSQGVYRIVDLRPGPYIVTFTLAGFNTVKREGVELSAGVSVPVNAEMRVGDIAETITVTGSGALIDLQSTTQHRTITEDLIENLPTGRAFQNMAVLIPGVTTATQDVGGTRGDRLGGMAIHGSTAGVATLAYDGMRFHSVWGSGSGIWVGNPATFEEVSIDTAGAMADAEVSGVRVNIIPKQGGNRLSGYFMSNFSNHRLQSDNLDEALKARGGTAGVTRKIWDINPAIGGPLKRDKLWFYASYRHYGTDDQPSGAYYAVDPAAFVYTPDLSRPAIAPFRNRNTSLRLTWQTSQRSKLAVYGDDTPRLWAANLLSSALVFEATSRFEAPVNNLFQATWNWTATNRLLFELGQTYRPEGWDYGLQASVPWDRSGVIETRTGVAFRAPGFADGVGLLGSRNNQWNGKATVSYVTGSSTFKVGSQWIGGRLFKTQHTPNDSWYNLSGGIPISVTLRTTPLLAKSNLKLNLGIWAQEQWTRKRLTLNVGGRFDYVNAYIPEQHAEAVRFAGARDFPRINDVPNWKDLSPRLGASYDLWGSGRTVVKWSVGRYLESMATGATDAINPMLSETTTRAWSDPDGDFVPDCDLTNPQSNGECGPNDNANFGKGLVTTRYAPNTITGWGKRTYDWETSTGIQSELRPGVSVEASYHRRWYGNFRVIDNALVTASDYQPYCVTAPVDPRLPGGGGYPVCGGYDIAPTKFGLSDNVITLIDDPAARQIYNGVDIVGSTRFRGGLVFQGGMNIGKTKASVRSFSPVGIGSSPIFAPTCFTVDSPQVLQLCNDSPQWDKQVKFLVLYPLPWWGLQTSATYQGLPGPLITASWAAPASEVTGLGRPLAGGQRTVTMQLVKPGTMYGERLNQIDFRIAKNFQMARTRLQGIVDLYNVFNANPVLTQNNTYGSRWQQPLAILPGRLVKFGVQLEF